MKVSDKGESPSRRVCFLLLCAKEKIITAVVRGGKGETHIVNQLHGNLCRLLRREGWRLVGHKGASKAIHVPSLGLISGLLSGGALSLQRRDQFIVLAICR